MYRVDRRVVGALGGVASGWLISHHEYKPKAYICCCTHCWTAVSHDGWVVRMVDGLVDGWVVGWVGGSFRTWVGVFVPVGGGRVFEGWTGWSMGGWVGTWVGTWVGGWVGGTFRKWAGVFVPVGDGPVIFFTAVLPLLSIWWLKLVGGWVA